MNVKEMFYKQPSIDKNLKLSLVCGAKEFILSNKMSKILSNIVNNIKDIMRKL